MAWRTSSSASKVVSATTRGAALASAGDRGGGGNAVGAGHPDVHQDDVRGQVRRRGDRRRPVAGLADDVDVRRAAQHQAQAGPDQGVVVDQQHPDGHRAAHGSQPASRNLSSPVTLASMWPPASAARSRRPIRPVPVPWTAVPAGRRLARRQPGGDRHGQPAVRGAVDGDLDRAARRVLAGIGEAFLDDPVEGAAGAGGYRPRARRPPSRRGSWWWPRPRPPGRAGRPRPAAAARCLSSSSSRSTRTMERSSCRAWWVVALIAAAASVTAASPAATGLPPARRPAR